MQQNNYHTHIFELELKSSIFAKISASVFLCRADTTRNSSAKQSSLLV